MWQEARRQEKHIKTLMVDYKRRAERRRDYYERIKQDPIKFLRVYGRPSKLHLDSEVVKAAENPNNMMPWIGDSTILIDRFDARANLESWDNQISEELKLTPIERIEERLCMYERYRCLIHNDYAGVTEEMALKQIEMDEKFGDLEKKRKEDEETSKKYLEPKAAIGFTYEDSTAPTSAGSTTAPPPSVTVESDSEGEADSDMDIDVELDLATLGPDGYRQVAKSASIFGLHSTDFVRLLDADQQLETELRLAKALEEEKLQLAGRKSRRARRILKERRSHEKFPKSFTTKVGLLNGQPISRRTVYLSASSSDSGDYPSEDDEVCAGHRNSSAAVRARRARAKPLLTNARGPSVLIGGMTSISLCRRRNHGLDPGEKMRKAAVRSSSSTKGSSRSSSSSTDRSSSRRYRRETDRHGRKRSRVEYITAFGDGEDDHVDSSSRSYPSLAGSWMQQKIPSKTASSVAASVVSKYLDSAKRSTSPRKYGVSARRETPQSPRRREITRNRSSSGSVRRSRQRSFGSRSRSNSRSASSSDYSGRNRSRKGRGRTRSSSSSSTGRDISRSSRRAHNSSRRSSPSSRRASSGSPRPRHESIRTGQSPTPPVRKRYYRPELESDEGSRLSDSSSSSSSVTGNGSGEQHSRYRDSRASNNMAGKMETHTTSGDRNHRTSPKPSDTGGKPTLTPQELLKRRMQAQLTKAFNADKKAELEKQLQLEKERQNREEGLRRQALLLRRQEEKRIRNERRAAAIASGAIPDDLSDSSSTSSDAAQGSGIRTRPSRFSSAQPAASSDRTPTKSASAVVRRGSPKSPSPSRRDRLPSPPGSTSRYPAKDTQSMRSGMTHGTPQRSPQATRGADPSSRVDSRFGSSNSNRTPPRGYPGDTSRGYSARGPSRPFSHRGDRPYSAQESGRFPSHRRGYQQSPGYSRSSRFDPHPRYS